VRFGSALPSHVGEKNKRVEILENLYINYGVLKIQSLANDFLWLSLTKNKVKICTARKYVHKTHPIYFFFPGYIYISGIFPFKIQAVKQGAQRKAH
jgi:hypothetical protein